MGVIPNLPWLRPNESQKWPYLGLGGELAPKLYTVEQRVKRGIFLLCTLFVQLPPSPGNFGKTQFLTLRGPKMAKNDAKKDTGTKLAISRATCGVGP